MDSFDLFFAAWGCLLPLGLLIGLYFAITRYQKATAKNRIMQKSMAKEISDRDQLIADLRAENAVQTKAEWFEELITETYRNEIEVETKFVYPILRLLGYENSELDVRYPINIQVGKNLTRGEADWVIWSDDSTNPVRRIRLVVEAKGETQPLTEEVIQQSRSYAFALNAPFYLCTNGRRLMIFRRGVEHDVCLLDCKVENLPQRWGDIQELIGANTDS